MAYINPTFGHQLTVMLGNGASPEVFSAVNLINTTRSITFSTSTETDELVDLADQSAPAQTVRRVKSTDIKIDGAGMVSKADVAEWVEFWQEGKPRNVKFSDGTITVTGPMVLSSFQVSGERTKTAENTITLEQAGAMTVVPVA